ncbi:MAG TPA: pilus assembly protein PilM, partial [Polyangiaceae bacterium]|nr:pilus assembly protein PilM [Polyangiaceae bacterium]
ESVSDAIAAEIQRSLDFFMATSGEAEIGRIFVTGGSANLVALAQAIERRARVPTEVWSPMERIVVDSKDINHAVVQQSAAQLAVALGLALRKEKETRA